MLINKEHKKIVEVLRRTSGTDLPVSFDTNCLTRTANPFSQCSDIVGESEVVVAPLFSACCDAYELLGDLRSAGFSGRVLVLANDVPDLSVIERDLAQVAGDVQFDVVDISPGALPTLH